MGSTHADSVRAVGDTIAAIVDPDSDRCNALADRYDAMPYSDLSAISDPSLVDVGIIATPSGDHLVSSEQCLRMGWHVLVEKPHRIPGETVTLLARLLKKSGLIYRVGMTTRFDAGITHGSRSWQR